MEQDKEFAARMLELAALMETNPTMRQLLAWTAEATKVDADKFVEWDKDTPPMEKLELDPLSIDRAKAILVLMLRDPGQTLTIVAHLVQEHRRLSIAEGKRRKVH